MVRRIARASFEKYSSLTPSLQMYNYSTGKLTNVAQALAKQHHDVNDVAGRMSGAAYQITQWIMPIPVSRFSLFSELAARV